MRKTLRKIGVDGLDVGEPGARLRTVPAAELSGGG